MKQSIETILKLCTGADRVHEVGVLQRLWSGYGSIVRYELEGAEMETVIVKHVSPPNAGSHPRGWNTDHSHQRKLRSYAVETVWYRDYANLCDAKCRLPHCFGVEDAGDEVVMVLEDLDAAGYPMRKAEVGEAELHACLRWLANFHARFLGYNPEGLWERGTYWHLETRPDELLVLEKEDPRLYAAAEWIDGKLKSSRFQTVVHGDAKLANFCFADRGAGVAAVDFQYVGGGCGMQDVAYFIGSCLNEEECASAEEQLLEVYFSALRKALIGNGESIPDADNLVGRDIPIAPCIEGVSGSLGITSPTINKPLDLDELEAEWRALYPVAWTDFHRFLKGWSPGHWKINSYSERLAREVVAQSKERD